jgi:hypothetical protein
MPIGMRAFGHFTRNKLCRYYYLEKYLRHKGKFNVDGTDQAENKIENSDFKLIQKDVIERFKEIIDQTSAS